jgi:hypothetical protein
VTTKERLHALVDELTDEEAAATLTYAKSQHRGNVDRWGDLDAWLDAASHDAMRMLDEEEQAAGFSWPQRERS